jgi:hypothetical protein
LQKGKEPKVIRVPYPGDGYWEQIENSEGSCYVFFYPPNNLRKTESIAYDHFHPGEQNENYSITYVPMEPTPWPMAGEVKQPGMNLWEDVYRFLYEHVDLPDERLYEVVTAWIFMTWIPEAFTTAPYLRFYGTKNVGKTRALEVLQHLCYRGTLSPSVTEAALYRLIHKYHITYLLDEAEVYGNEQRQAIQHVLNAGYRRGQHVFRCETADNGEIVIRGFEVFGPKAIAGTRMLKETLESRCIQIVMQRNSRPVNFLLNMWEAKRLRCRLLMWRFYRLHDLECLAGEVSEGSEVSEVNLEAPHGLHKVENSRIVELYAPLIKLAETLEARQSIIDHAVESHVQNVEEEAASPEAQVLYSIMACRERIQSGKFATSWVTEYYNSEFGHDWAPTSVGRLIKSLGFQSRRIAGGRAGYIYDSELVEKLCRQYKVEEGPPSGATSLTSLPSLTSLEERLEWIVQELRRGGKASCHELCVRFPVPVEAEEVEKLLRVLEQEGTVYCLGGVWRLTS